MHSKQSVSFS